MMRDPKTVPIPAPEPAQPTVAAPAPMNLAAESISRVTAVVWNDRTCGRSATGVVFWAANVWLWLMTALLNGRMNDPLIAVLATGAIREAVCTNIFTLLIFFDGRLVLKGNYETVVETIDSVRRLTRLFQLNE